MWLSHWRGKHMTVCAKFSASAARKARPFRWFAKSVEHSEHVSEGDEGRSFSEVENETDASILQRGSPAARVRNLEISQKRRARSEFVSFRNFENVN